MSWGILTTSGGPVLLAVGRDISERRAAEARLHAVASIGERALAGAVRSTWPARRSRCCEPCCRSRGTEVSRGRPHRSRHVRVARREPASSHDRQRRWSCCSPPSGPSTASELSFVRAVGEHARHRPDSAAQRGAHAPRGRCTMRLPGWPTGRCCAIDSSMRWPDRSASAAPRPCCSSIWTTSSRSTTPTATQRATPSLVEIARRLQIHEIRPGDTIARLGGDEFVAVCEDIDQDGGPSWSPGACGRPSSNRSRPAGAEHQLSASIGVALGDTDPDSLLANADAAAYQAKAAGRGRIELFR